MARPGSRGHEEPSRSLSGDVLTRGSARLASLAGFISPAIRAFYFRAPAAAATPLTLSGWLRREFGFPGETIVERRLLCLAM
jgi:hypothetical protein